MITITTADGNGASGTTSRTKKFAAKVFQGTSLIRQEPVTPSGGNWSAKWNSPLPDGDYRVTAGAAEKLISVTGPDPTPSDRLYPTSPFWTPVSANPTLDPNSAAIVKNFLAQGGWGPKPVGAELGSNDWTRPYYEAKATDPTVTVHGGLGGSWTDASCEGNVIHVPKGARPAGGSNWQALDGGLMILQPDGMMYSAWRSEDPVSGRAYQWAKIDSNYSGAAKDHGTGIGQAQLGPVIGKVMYQELVVDQNIPHGLFAEVRNWYGRRYPGWYPDDGKTRGGQVSDPTAPPMSGHFYLAYSDAEIGALSVPSWHKVLLRAMAKFGIYTYDNGGSAHSLDWESGIPYLVRGEPNPWVAFAKSVGISNFDIEQSGKVDWSRFRLLPR